MSKNTAIISFVSDKIATKNLQIKCQRFRQELKHVSSDDLSCSSHSFIALYKFYCKYNTHTDSFIRVQCNFNHKLFNCVSISRCFITDINITLSTSERYTKIIIVSLLICTQLIIFPSNSNLNSIDLRASGGRRVLISLYNKAHSYLGQYAFKTKRICEMKAHLIQVMTSNI